MYHRKVIEYEQADLEKRLGLKLTRYSPSYSQEVADYLSQSWSPERGLSRDLRKEEADFIKNERLLCSLDFSYWCRYAFILADAATGGGLQRFEPWEAQQLILAEIERMELEQWEQARKGEPQDGVLLCVPKARQEGVTMLARLLLMHILTTTPHTLGVTGSVTDEKVLKLWERDIRILDNLPFYLRPSRGAPDIQGEHLTFDKLDSSLLYQEFTQESAIASGEQYPIGHMTEVAQAPYPGRFQLDYFPAIPQSWRSLHILEATPDGRGNWWHTFIRSAMQGKERWRVKFIPWYTTAIKNRRKPPQGWSPSPVALDHAKKVWDTSPEYIGKHVMLTEEQLYWWETTRNEYASKGELAFFLTNYAGTLEESFQSSGKSIFGPELIEHYRLQTMIPPTAYEITGVGASARIHRD